MRSGSTLAFPPLTPGVKRLLIVLGGAFVAQLIVSATLDFNPVAYQQYVTAWLGLSVDGVLSGRVWQVVTYAFLHAMDGWGHVLANALGLYLLGSAVEMSAGRKALYRLVAYGAVGGAIAVLAYRGTMTALGYPQPTVVGASGAISAILAAFCFLNWNRRVYLFFLPMEGRHLLLLAVVVDAVRWIGPAPVAVDCHFGGMLAGWLWVRGWINPRRAWLSFKHWRLKRKLRVIHGRDSDEQPTYLN